MEDRSRSGQANANAAGLVLGIGMGGFVDGILLHQIVQAHAMLSARVPLDSMENMRTNMTADGIFHAFVWAATAAGIALLWRALAGPHESRPSGRAFFGSMLAGWGLFNLVEGVIDHHLLGLHHVVERLGLSIWDWLFLAWSLVLIGAGRLLAKAPR
jgi:uncharacterized membrane protein